MNWRSFFNNKNKQCIDTAYKGSGGLALRRNKPGLCSAGTPIDQIRVPPQLVLPLLDYKKHIVKPCVNVGDHVRVGDWLASGVLASTNGVVSAIEPRAIIHPSHLMAPCVIIDVDQDSASSNTDDNVMSVSPWPASAAERIARANVSGLGGAGFSTSDKLVAASNASSVVSTLLINAVECEPIISCDEALIHSDSEAIIKAIEQMISVTACTRCVLAIEDDKLDAIQALRSAINTHANASRDLPAIELVLLSPIYPSGAERVLIQRITGQSLSSDTRAADLGILCLNVATVLAASRAQKGYPLISRIITVAGNASSRAVNVRVQLGTSVQHVLEQTGNKPVGDQFFLKNHRVRAGGPLSGFDLTDLNVPITATTNCLTIDPSLNKKQASPCIRCSQCSDVCPVQLLPQQLFWHTDKTDVVKAMRFGLNECIECGCCDVVCPSAIELTASFRHAKSLWQEQQRMSREAELAKQRHEQREQRLVQRQLQAERLREQKAAQLQSTNDKQDPIAAAMARARAKRVGK